jgi:hypothetical protein
MQRVRNCPMKTPPFIIICLGGCVSRKKWRVGVCRDGIVIVYVRKFLLTTVNRESYSRIFKIGGTNTNTTFLCSPL